MLNRQQTIRMAVGRYMAQYPEEYELLKEVNLKRRAMLIDKKFGRMKNEKGKVDSFTDSMPVRLGFSIPEKLNNVLTSLCKNEKDKFFQQKDERKWFYENFPEFYVPEKLNIDSSDNEK